MELALGLVASASPDISSSSLEKGNGIALLRSKSTCRILISEQAMPNPKCTAADERDIGPESVTPPRRTPHPAGDPIPNIA